MDTTYSVTKKNGKFKFITYTTAGLFMFFIKLPMIDSTLFRYVISITQTLTAPFIDLVLLVFLSANALFTIAISIFKWQGLAGHTKIQNSFTSSPFKILISLLAPIIVFLYLTALAPSINELSAEVIGMCSTVFVFLVISKLMLPLVSDYGLAEYMEELLNPIMRPIFRLPGISIMAILTSSFVSVTVAVMLITDQYFKGEYSKRETLFLITCLSLPAMSITLLLSDLEGFSDQWGIFYLLIALSAILLSIIMVRLPIFTKMGDEYPNGSVGRQHQEVKSIKSRVKQALVKASARANTKHASVFEHIQNVLLNMTSFLPFIVVLGTLALFLVNRTPIVEFLAKPYAIYLGFFGFSNADLLAPTLFISTIDIVLPSIVLTAVPDLTARLLMQVILLTQITYMAPVLLALDIPGLTSPIKILKIYLLRALAVVPIVVFLSKIFL